MKKLKLAICSLDENDNVIAISDALSSEWDQETEDQMKTNFDIDIKIEMASALVKELAKSMSSSNLKKLIKD